ncbi:hypothetical protein EDB84DRAFT_1568618 [Lactarius hengduanensis]|nr:hypothetical protein EDB84DRAFT_1568618 [Lactarius hengduanensis]
MSILHPGTAYLSSRALLEYPRALPGHSNVIIFDAVIRPTQPTLNVPTICCSLQYTKRQSEEALETGIYEIFAKIVAFERDVHPRSPVRYESEFLLMGDILTLRPLPAGTDALITFDYPTRIVASGSVSTAHIRTDTFTMMVSQMPCAVSPDAHLHICGLMTFNPMCPQPNARVPCPTFPIAFTGRLLAIEELEDPVANVDVDDVTFLPRPAIQSLRAFNRLRILAQHSHHDVETTF